MRKITLLMGALLLFVMPVIALADSISPSSFSGSGPTGSSYTITKTVTVSSGTSTSAVDVFFLADTTGSMGGAIAGVISSASTILSGAAALGGDVAFGVGEYKDTYDAYRYRLNQDITTTQATAQAGINMWSAGGGSDGPEAQLYALYQVATTTSWRTGTERMVVWFGDWAGHDPDGGISEANATAALVAAGINVLAIDVGDSYAGIDTCTYGCDASGEGGAATSGQATRIATATGGSYTTSTNSSAIVAAIEEALEEAFSTYSSVGLDLSEVPAAVGVEVTPGSYTGSFDRSIERTFAFEVTFTDKEPGTHTFNIYATVDGARVATESDSITSTTGVPEPGMMLLLGSGLMGLAALRRRIKA